jgi:hypothetical protein
MQEHVLPAVIHDAISLNPQTRPKSITAVPGNACIPICSVNRLA